MSEWWEEGGPPLRLPWPDNIRLRPSMYVFDVHYPEALCYMVCGLFHRAEDHHLAGRGTRLDVCLDDDGRVVISADAALYGVDPDDAGRTELERMFVEGEPGSGQPYPYGTRPTEIESCALGDSLEVVVHDGTLAHRVRFARGVLVDAVGCIGATSRVETTLTLRPDLTILTHDAATLADYVARTLDELSSRCPALTVSLQTPTTRAVLRSPRGLADQLTRRAIDAPPLTPLLHARGVVEGWEVEVALQWHRREDPSVRTIQLFARRFGPYHNGGQPVSGVRAAIRQWLAAYEVEEADAEMGLQVVIRVEGPNLRLSTNYLSVYGEGAAAAASAVTTMALAELGAPPDALLAWLRAEGDDAPPA